MVKQNSTHTLCVAAVGTSLLFALHVVYNTAVCCSGLEVEGLITLYC